MGHVEWRSSNSSRPGLVNYSAVRLVWFTATVTVTADSPLRQHKRWVRYFALASQSSVSCILYPVSCCLPLALAAPQPDTAPQPTAVFQLWPDSFDCFPAASRPPQFIQTTSSCRQLSLISDRTSQTIAETLNTDHLLTHHTHIEHDASPVSGSRNQDGAAKEHHRHQVAQANHPRRYHHHHPPFAAFPCQS